MTDPLRVLITGAGGMLGTDLAEVCDRRRHYVIPLTRQRLDITDARAVDEVIAREQPDVVVNCAAWTDVDGAEEHEAEANRINDQAAALVAAAAADVGAKFVFLSTDYVFDGTSRAPYVESSIPAPLNAYGRSKLGGETSCAVANERIFVVRTSWLFGMAGGNFVDTMIRLGRSQPEVSVVHDQHGSPTYTLHLAKAIADLIETEDFGIHHITGGGSCSWYDFAQEIFDQAGIDCRVLGATTAMMARPATRPAFSVLGSEREAPITLPPWQHGLSEYLLERAEAEGTA